VTSVYLTDVSTPTCDADNEPGGRGWESAFRKSRWFTRGWTLQELIAPTSVEFFSKEGLKIGNKTSLEQQIHGITGIPVNVLRGSPPSNSSVSERMAWIKDRETTRKEDKAYSLLGIFDVHMPLLYGEGRKNAFSRLLAEVNKAANDELDWRRFRSHADNQIVPHWIVPFDRNKDFVGRESILAKLLEAIPPSADKDACQWTAIEGLGGIGKTQVALEAAFRVREKHRDCSVFWVPAIDAATFENAYRDVGRQLHITGIEEEKADVKSLVKAALSRSNYHWLLVIDNADDLDLLFYNRPNTPLFNYLPSGHKGSILFTTRNDAVVRELDISSAHVIRVAELSRPEAKELLQSNLDAAQLSDSESTTRLLDFLADLPLAIKQASVYMARTRMTVTKYFDHCWSSDESFIALLSKDFVDRSRYKTTRNPIATTWLISFRYISRDNQRAAQYLQFMSLLAEKDIPKSLLPPGANALEVDEAIAVLEAYAFLSKRPDQASYDMHRLVPLVMRNWLARERKLKECIGKVIQRLAEIFPSPEHKNRATWEKYLPHAQKALAFQNRAGNKIATWKLLNNVAESNSRLGKYAEAEKMYRQALSLQARMKSQHANNSNIRWSRFYVREVFRQMLAVRTNALGAKHPLALSTGNSLASTLRYQGRYRESEEVYRQTCSVQRKVLGAEHPDTLLTRHGLATVLGYLGKFTEAAEIYMQTLVARAKVLGAEHPQTLLTRNGLTAVFVEQGKYARAEEINRQTLAVQMKVLGAGHPNILWTKHGLAAALGHQGKHTEAEEIYRQVLAVQTRVLGLEHPNILWTKHGLAATLRDQGNYMEAEEMYRQTLAVQAKVLGAEHPYILPARVDFASTLRLQGKYAEAEEIYQRILALRKEGLGAEHPHLLRARNGLATTLYLQGKYGEAEEIYQPTLTVLTKVLGAEHPDTLSTKNGLTKTLRSLEKERSPHALFPNPTPRRPAA